MADEAKKTPGQILGEQPAFPQHLVWRPDLGQCGVMDTSEDHGVGGMTIRVYLAGEAMKGILADSSSSDLSPTSLAGCSREFADALLEELAK
jgi:hypothetical protein